MSYKNPDYQAKYQAKYNEYLKHHAVKSISSGHIIDQHKWDLWVNAFKRSANQTNKPYSEDFTNDIIFAMMLKGCFYCGQLSTSIDRIVSYIHHTPDNCVASCWGCNCSKGVSDSATFIRKAYYRARGEYIDDITDIWFVNKQKPTMQQYKRNALKKGVSFELTKGDWDTLIKGDCKYCHRSPSTWFGVDRVIPSKGYILENVVSCCWDCNNDKHIVDVDMMIERNERIAKRVDNGVLIVNECVKVPLHKGTQKTSKKVCAYGKVYESQCDASRALGKNDRYICNCIHNGRHSNDIFDITDYFYDFSVENKLENITKKMYILFFRM